MAFASIITNTYKPKRLAVKLKAKGEHSVLSGHPWVFSNSIAKINSDAKTGDLAVIFSKTKNRFIGLGLFDAQSPIKIKMLHNNSKGVEIDTTFFQNKIKEAYKKRERLLQTNTNSYRLLFGENDGFPGLIADIYATVLVVKIYSEIWLPYLEIILPILQQTSQVSTIVIRLSRSLQQSKSHQLKDGAVVYGSLENPVVHFIEHGVKFSANVIKGHKTGYFLDHRANRKQVGLWSKGKTVLDVFSYAGGFSVHALSNGAREVASLDVSKQALHLALYNAQLNVHSGTHRVIAGDAFMELKKLIANRTTFDVVVIDPPSFAKQASEIPLAKKKYAQLALLGVQLTSKNGLLVLASCSSRIIADSFFNINISVLSSTNRKYKTVLKTHHDSDHPVSFSEGAYLKCGYYRFMD